MRRADRLMGIVHFLRSRRGAVTAERIAEEFEVCTRTVYRDMADLMASRVPVSGAAGVGYMIDRRFYLPPVAFDADELEAIALGIAMVRQWSDAGFAAHADAALAKVRAVLPAEMQGELDQTTYSIPVPPALPWTVDFSGLRACIRERRRVRLDYADAAGRTSTRTVRPLALVFAAPAWLLAAWCETRADFRNFRLDRMAAMEAGDTFEDDPGRDLAAYRAEDGVC